MSDSKLVWYHVATHEWRDAPPKDGTWAMSHIKGRPPFAGLPDDLAIIHRLDAERSKLERENAALRADKERLDWLARNRSVGVFVVLSAVSATERPLSVTPESLRAALDAARAKEAQP